VPKATKLLTKLFPNKVAIHMPQVCVVVAIFFFILLDQNFMCSFLRKLVN
jgi:hypothetical protein